MWQDRAGLIPTPQPSQYHWVWKGFRWINIIYTRAGIVRELTRPLRSKFKMAWLQFSTIQFPNHKLGWKVCSAQFGAHWGQVIRSVRSIQFIQFPSQALPELIYAIWDGFLATIIFNRNSSHLICIVQKLGMSDTLSWFYLWTRFVAAEDTLQHFLTLDLVDRGPLNSSEFFPLIQAWTW